MATSFQTIAQLLRELEFEFFVKGSNEKMLVQFLTPDMEYRLDIFVTLQDEGNFLQLSALLGKVPQDAEGESSVMKIINEYNSEFRVFKVRHDEENCIRATADLPLHEAEMSPMQFRYVFDLFTNVAMRFLASLKSASVADLQETATLD